MSGDLLATLGLLYEQQLQQFAFFLRVMDNEDKPKIL